jgi:hypothetical protein
MWYVQLLLGNGHETSIQQLLLGNGPANKHVSTATMEEPFCKWSMLRYYKQGQLAITVR